LHVPLAFIGFDRSTFDFPSYSLRPKAARFCDA
jgi:hypothetical protein